MSESTDTTRECKEWARGQREEQAVRLAPVAKTPCRQETESSIKASSAPLLGNLVEDLGSLLPGSLVQAAIARQ
jgi:hypothetical protein